MILIDKCNVYLYRETKKLLINLRDYPREIQINNNFKKYWFRKVLTIIKQINYNYLNDNKIIKKNCSDGSNVQFSNYNGTKQK